MSWENNMVTMLREVIGDNDSIARYSNNRLIDVIVTSACIVVTTISFSNSYAVDVTLQTITPDPITLNDKDMVWLTVCKASLMIARSEHRTAADKAVNIKDGPSSIDLKAVAEHKKAWADQLDKDYKDAVIAYKTGAGLVGRAIVTPSTYLQFSDNITTNSGDYTESPRFS